MQTSKNFLAAPLTACGIVQGADNNVTCDKCPPFDSKIFSYKTQLKHCLIISLPKRKDGNERFLRCPPRLFIHSA